MADRLLLALAQLNPVVGAIAGNAAKLLLVWREAGRQGADLVLAPELVLSGYPAEDLTVKPDFLDAIEQAVADLAEATKSGPDLLIGAPWREQGKLHNAALLLEGGRVSARVFKHNLPNYGPFDEKRIFTPGGLPEPIVWRGHRLGVLVCEDMWTPEAALHLMRQGAEILLTLNGSPFETGKLRQRLSLARDRAHETGLPLVYLNLCGGQDELVFDGASFVVNSEGAPMVQLKAWQEDFLLTHWEKNPHGFVPITTQATVLPEGEAALYHALMLGVADYARKNGFERALLGLSGGIDSALVAALAVDALGPGKLQAVMLPSPHTSPESLADAQDVARLLGCSYDSMPITPAMQAFDLMLAPWFKGTQSGVAEENIQARCRGLALMALSNKFGGLLLATGNKSEMATGYATLYGDMCGGYAPLKDVYKTEVYRLARWRNANRPEAALGPEGVVIPDSILTKAPSAELRPGQKDQDSLPPYEILDSILEGVVEHDLGVMKIVEQEHDPATVRRVLAMLAQAEYKRRQAPPGPKVTRRHLARDRRYPITNRYVGGL